jgi:hypothetical protein
MTEKSVVALVNELHEKGLLDLRCLAGPQVTRERGRQSGSTVLRTPLRLLECSGIESASVTRVTVTTVTLRRRPQKYKQKNNRSVRRNGADRGYGRASPWRHRATSFAQPQVVHAQEIAVAFGSSVEMAARP